MKLKKIILFIFFPRFAACNQTAHSPGIITVLTLNKLWDSNPAPVKFTGITTRSLCPHPQTPTWIKAVKTENLNSHPMSSERNSKTDIIEGIGFYTHYATESHDITSIGKKIFVTKQTLVYPKKFENFSFIKGFTFLN